MNSLHVGDRVRLNVNGSFELPRIANITDDNVVLQRRKKGRKIGTVSLPKHRFVEMVKSFHSATHSCTVLSKI